MSEYGERLDLPLQENAETVCPPYRGKICIEK